MPESHPSAVSGAFRRPFTEQIAFFRRKLGNLVPTERWDDITGAAHDDAFMVAGAQKADLLTDLAAAVDRSIAEGKSLGAFRQDFRAIVERNGWHGWTGEDTKAGRAWRTRTIYRTNASTSYSAGRHAQLVQGDFPLWVYRHGDSIKPRPVHLALNGVTLPPSDPFWQVFYPPSAWGCSCYVLGARSERGARRLGGDPAKALPADWDAIDPKTGAPVGVDKGWNYAPGASVAPIVQAMAAKIGAWDYRIAKAFMEDVPADRRDALALSYRSMPSVADDVRRYAEQAWEGDDPTPGRTLGQLTRDQASLIADGHDLDAQGFDFSLSPSEIAHVHAGHGDDVVEQRRGQRAVTPADFALLPRVVGDRALRFVGTSTGHKLPVFEISAEIDGETFVTRWEYWRRRRTLTLLNFFVRTGKRA